MTDAQVDLAVYGATGFTGRLVCAYLQRQTMEGRTFTWAMAGRSLEKLEAQRAAMEAPEVPLICADSDDPASLDRLAKAARVVVSTVGPYQLYGTPLLAACAGSGTDYVDLCGEPLWMREMIDRFEGPAKTSGSRILFSSGFDSIPAELGVWLCQQEAMRLFGKPLPRIRGRMRTFIGGPSGGSVASGMAMMQLSASDPAKAALLADPFALTPGFVGPEHPVYNLVEEEPDLGVVGPFTLGPTDMKNVHRSNYLMGHAYGADFVYDEKLVSPPSPPTQPPTIGAMPMPGEGPSDYVMEHGCFDLLMIGEGPRGQTVRLLLAGSDDPYTATAALVSETAIALLHAENLQPGIWTPVAALGEELAAGILAHAGILVRLEAAAT